MKRLAVFIISIIAIVLVADIAVGISCRYYIRNHELSGRYKPLDKLIKNVDTDIILIGNSIILNAIDPQVLQDSLQMSCYNGGITGKSIQFSEILIDCILQRHTPKTIIIAMRPEEAGANSGDGIFDVLKPYYNMGYESIDNYFNSSSASEQLLLKSNLLRYNTIWVRVLLYTIFGQKDWSDNGFVANEVPAILPQIKTVDDTDTPIARKTDSFRRIVSKCQARGVHLVVCFPPALLHFTQPSLPCVTAISDICNQHGVECYADYADSSFTNHPELFFDNYHMNRNGAEKYSRMLVRHITTKK